MLESISPSAAELTANALTAENLARAVRALREDGIIVVENVIDLDHIRILRERVLEDVELFVSRADATFNWNRGNVQQDPPPFPPYLFRDVLANDIVTQVTESVLGAGVVNGFYSGNTALPSTSRQPVHADTGQLWPDQQHVHPAFGLVVNIGLVDMSPENGSTEIWPGTHQDPIVAIQSGDIVVAPEEVEARRLISPPFQPTVRQGSVIIRDLRLWHAGMPNRTGTPRPMLAMIHFVSWWRTEPFRLHPSAEALLAHPHLRQHATYTEDLADYASGPTASAMR